MGSEDAKQEVVVARVTVEGRSFRPEVVALDRGSSIRAQDRARSGQLRLRSEEGPTVLDRWPVMDS